jgi:alpha-mannosidase
VVEPVHAAGESAGRKTVVVDLPPLGFAWVAPGGGTQSDSSAGPKSPSRWSLFGKKHKQEPPLVQRRVVQDSAPRAPARGDAAQPAALETVLCNEFFSVVIDPHTGAIRSIFDDRARGPRLAQQLALRLPSGQRQPAGDAAYSIMAADEVEIVSAGPVLGEVVVRGRLMSAGGQRQAGFQQTTRIWRGSRVIELLVDLDTAVPPGSDPWNSYYAVRFAWPDETAKLHRSANLAVVASEATQLESPHFIDLRTAKTRTTLLVAGLPWHRRVGPRKLDTLLIVPGESCRHFRLGIGIELPNPLAAAMDFLAPPAMLAGAARPAHATGWLFHLDVRSVLATHWEPLAQGGFRVRLLETEGRQVQLNLRALRPLAWARKTGSNGQSAEDLPVEDYRTAIELRPYEWAEVEAEFRV